MESVTIGREFLNFFGHKFGEIDHKGAPTGPRKLRVSWSRACQCFIASWIRALKKALVREQMQCCLPWEMKGEKDCMQCGKDEKKAKRGKANDAC